jgi:hypothetical protein
LGLWTSGFQHTFIQKSIAVSPTTAHVTYIHWPAASIVRTYQTIHKQNNMGDIGDAFSAVSSVRDVAYLHIGNNVTASTLGSAETHPAPEEMILHLKVLQTFDKLRREICNTEGLFGYFSSAGMSQMEIDRVQEKRWQVYLTRAVKRFTVWWETMVPATIDGVGVDELRMSNIRERLLDRFHPMQTVYRGVVEDVPGRQMSFRDALPPLGVSRVSDSGWLQLTIIDVLMVWHSYVLSPQCFLEDCLRTGKQDFWITGFPLHELVS